ncbi:MAG: hypothetical protein GY772_16570, partial [bacterium]|nr:hypothetical protein [bacterium]
MAEPMQIDWAVVTRDDKAGEAVPYKVRLERVVHQYGMKQVNGRLTWQREIRHEDVERFQIGQDGASGALSFKVLESGSYRLLAEQVGGRGVAEFTFYAGSGAPAHTQTDPQLLELTLDSAAYEPGDTASLEVRGQFDGQLLITLETDRVLTSQVIDFKAPAANLQIQLPGDLRGGAFFSASLIRGIDPTQTSWLPHRARGLKRVKTTHMEHMLPLALQAPKRVAPGETVTIHASSGVISLEDSEAIEAGAAVTEAGQAEAAPEVPAGRPARLHVWAVDTGVLLATGEKLPDPHAHFFAQHKSSVGTVDSWAHLLPDHMRADSVLRIGGDTGSEEAMARRLTALPPTQRSSGVAWSRAVDMGPDGSIDLDLEMPNIRGAVTLRAVLVDGDSYACSEQRIELATDLQVTATWPRYSTSGDRLRVPVKLLNTTDAPMEARLEASTEGPITFAPERGYQPLQLAANEEVLVWFLAETPEPGTAQIELSAVRSAGIDSIQTEFQVRPATAFHQETRLAKVEAGRSMTFDPTANFESSGLRVNVEISGDPQIELRPALRALLDYPHGCLEQTTSRLYALVNAGALLEGESGLVESMVHAGILRLHAMQTRSGGLGYWMGNTSPSTWGSAYAGGFLAEAKRAGFDVPVSLSSPLVEFLSKQLRSGKQPLGTQALMCRVLAAFGQPQEGWMSRVQEQLSDLDLAGRAHLAAAWLQLGRRDRAMECLHEDTL